ncbi:LuxR C-terminal-related transcriptional regulator [Arthrobacter bambusae]|uniref:LuxR C-terminal-related transcriptional regulator n=1 Tax=Arthrobacter bambusae TaxID=1338426 RepID=UPI00278AB8FE|nr:LuxR C-terminal-related transcriptional regulator [Arthrobacter bambusae]MDQ0029229.1 DNA-binding CsgD family transcriptional regulator [Arthrobacter bambusae]MDQ0098138.1 DNA-binding CsgD family transcriptional regulator [Arthrobacter bambusae]
MLTAGSASTVRAVRSGGASRYQAFESSAAPSSSEGSESKAVISTSWPPIGPRAAVEDIALALAASKGGVLVTGPSGSGKSYLTTRAVNELRERSFVVVVRGSAALARSPYGALNILLSDLDPGYLAHPVLVLSALTNLLRERAEGKRVYLVIENATELDELAAMTVAQLARNGTAQLVLTCTDPQRLCGEITRLCGDGFLHRIDLKPLTFQESHAWLEAGLGAQVSPSGAHALWTASGGNPHYLKMLAAELAESGALLKSDGVWVLTSRSEHHGRAITDLITTRLGRMGGGERKVLEILSLAKAVPLESLLALASADDVDSLEKRGVLVVDDSLPRMARLQSQLVGDVVRANVPTGRSNELRSLLLESTDPGLGQRSMLLTMAAWALDCGAKLGEEEALEAAAVANRQLDARLALRLVRSIPGHSAIPGAVAQEARALMTLGDIAGARDVLRQHPDGAGDEGALADWVRLKLAETSVLLARPETTAQACETLAHVRRRLEGEKKTAGEGQAIATLREELVLAESQAASYSGSYAEMATRLEEELDDFESHGTEFRLLAGSWLCEAWALTGRQSEAADMAEQLAADCHDPAVSVAAARRATSRLRFAFVLAGRWDKEAEMVQPGDDLLVSAEALPTAIDLPQAIFRCIQGRGQDGLDALIPVISQLRVQDNEGMLDVACTAAAYASALQGEEEQALRYLKEASTQLRRPTWRKERTKRYLAALARERIDGPETAVEELLRLADADRDEGAPGHEIFCLSSAVRLGAVAAAPRLLDSALRCQGQFAELCVAYARATISGSAEMLLEAARMAEAMQNDRFAFDIAETVLHLDQVQLDKTALRRARQLAETCRQRLRTPQSGNQEGLKLTARELEIARLAANRESNKGIAAKLHVSVRTVEGHLYQIFGKLKIVERSELSFALGNVEGGAK